MKNNKKPNKTRAIFVTAILVTAVIGACSGLIYMDTFYGEGKIKQWYASVTNKSAQVSSTEAANNAGEDEKSDEPTNQPIDEPTSINDAISLEAEGNTYFAIFGKKFLMCTKDGVQFLNSIGDQKWNDTYTMASPYAIQEGNFVAVGDMSGRTIHVYNDIGKQYSVQSEGTLVWFALNINGYLSVISNNDSHYNVMIYDQSGQQLKGRVEESPGIYPMSVDVSNDNTVFAISYLDISDVESISKILFFYLGEPEQGEFTDSMFAAASEEDQVIPLVSFMKDDVLAVISDEKIIGFNKAGKEAWEIVLSNRIEQVDFGNSSYINVALGDTLSGKDGLEPGTVWWINSDGKTTATFKTESNVDYLKASNDIVIVGSHNHFYGVKHNGKVIWEYSSKADVQNVLMLDSATKALLVSKQKAEIVDMSQQAADKNDFKATEKNEPTQPDNTKESDDSKEPIDDETQEEQKV